MSRTSLIGVVGANHWAYMAGAMVERLDQIIKGQETKIGLGILYDASLFFKVALGQKTGTFFDNHLARRNAHVIAWEILNDCQTLRSRMPKEVNGHFRRFADFLKSLAAQPTVPIGKGGWCKQLVPLEDKNQKTAIDLRDFFEALLRKAERKGRH